MRRWIFRSIKILLVLVAAFWLVRTLRDDAAAAAQRRFRSELQRTMLSGVIWSKTTHEGATFKDALAWIESEARKAGLAEDVRFVARTRDEVQHRFRRRVRIGPPELSAIAPSVLPAIPSAGFSAGSPDAIPLADSDPEPASVFGPAPPGSATMSVSELKIPVYEVCRYIAALANYTPTIGDRTAEFIPNADGGTYEPLARREWRTLIFQAEAPLMPKLSSGHRDARAELERLGIVFYEGSSAEYDRDGEMLVVVDTPSQLENVNSLCASDDDRPPTKWERFKEWVRSRFQRNSAASSHVTGRLR